MKREATTGSGLVCVQQFSDRSNLPITLHHMHIFLSVDFSQNCLQNKGVNNTNKSLMWILNNVTTCVITEYLYNYVLPAFASLHLFIWVAYVHCMDQC